MILVNFRGGPVLILELFSILVNFRVGPVLILKFFSILLLVIFRVGPVKRNTLYITKSKNQFFFLHFFLPDSLTFQ